MERMRLITLASSSHKAFFDEVYETIAQHDGRVALAAANCAALKASNVILAGQLLDAACKLEFKERGEDLR